jgi:hypothetical protein
VSLLQRAQRRTPARVRLIEVEEERVPLSGAVSSVQEAEVTLPRGVLEALWRPEYLERLARAYWRHINRATLGLVRIVYAPSSRAAVLLTRHLPLLTFRAPRYEATAARGVVTWPIERGLLVAREGHSDGFLRITVERDDLAATAGNGAGAAEEVRLTVRLEVRNFYPWLRGEGRFARLGAWIYSQTQLRIHVLVCNAFLRSLTRLELPPSRIGALAGEIDAGAADAAEAAERAG